MSSSLHCRNRIRRPQLMFLEHRLAPAVLTVNALGDANAGTGNAGDIRYCLGKAANGDIIYFDSTLFASPQVISLTSQLVVSGNITINGPGPALATIANIAAAGATSRVLRVDPGFNVSISGLTISGGNLTATNRGAGIESLAASLNLSNCVISGNSTVEDGAGIAVTQDGGSLSLVNCTINGNHATGVFSDGGGVYMAANGSLALKNSTIASNDATRNGGGVYFFLGGGYTIENCTISGNSAAGKGGAIYFYGEATMPVAIRNSTVAGNTASVGGGLYFNSFTSGMTLSSSIVAQNAGAPNDIYGAGNVAGSNNLVFDASGGFTLTGSGNIVGVDPMLDILSNNGGMTQTRALKAGSPAIDAGNNLMGMSFDQRGTGFPRSQGNQADIGAFESPSTSPSATFVPLGPVVTVGNSPNTLQVTYTDTNAINVSTIGVGNIEIIAPDSSKLTITAANVDIASNGSPRVVTYTFVLPGGTWDTADNGDYQVNLLSNQVADTDFVPQFVPAGPLGTFSVRIPATYTVDVAADIDDANYSSGNLSFREAVKLANASAGTNDTITFDAAVFAGATTITMANGQFNIVDALTILGPGASKLTLNANSAGRHFNIDVPASSNNPISITGMTLANGAASLNHGGSILNYDENVTLTNLVMTNNSSGRSGGAIALTTSPATLVVMDSTFSQNASNGPMNGNFGGGAVFAFGNSKVTLLRCTVSGNVSTNQAGGIYMYSGGSLVATDCTLSGNSAVRQGGAITSQSAAVNIVNSTLAGNIAAQGGGIRQNLGGSLIVNNSTIVANTANGLNGGGVSIATTLGSFSMSSTIVANNTNANVPDISTPAAFTIGGGNNLIGVADKGNFTLSGTNKTGTLALPLDPLLAPLTNNGGPTWTMGLTAASPALNAGADNGYPFDQRGAGFPRKVGTSADIGAFEGTVGTPVAKFASFGPIVIAGPTPNSLTVTYSDDVGINMASIDIADITILDPLANQLTITGFSASPNSNGTPRAVTYTFTPPGGSWDVADNGAYAVSINASQVFDTDPTPQSVVNSSIGKFQVAVPLTYLIDEATDVDDGNYGKGFLSLREAVKLSNTTNVGVSDQIVFDTNIFKAGTKITLSGTPMTISDPVSIQGPGAANLTLDGNAASRLFDINMVLAGAGITISGLTLNNGQVIDDAGGAIRNVNSALTLSQVIILGNKAVISTGDAHGGAIAVVSSTASLNLVDCTLANNVVTGATGQGGAIHVQGDSAVFILRSTVSGNQSGEDGGAIYFYADGTLSVTDSTISGNKSNVSAAGAGGGGVYLFGTVATIRNSTISGNSTDSGGLASNGGGIAALSSSSLTMQNSTVAFNAAGATSGGGLFLGTGTTISSESSIIAKNTATLGPDIAGQLVARFSLIGDNTGATLLTGSANNVVNVDPLLSPLANNGGTTMTHALKSGSPAINAGSNPLVVSYDQRGIGFARQSGVATDVGSFELQPPAKVASVIINGGAMQRSQVTSILVNFDQIVVLASAFQLVRQSDNMGVSINAAIDNTGTGTAATLTFTGGAVDGASLADGRYTLTVLAGQVTNINGTLDGNGNGVVQGSPADDFVFASSASPNPPTNIFRLFGDSDGDGAVAASDFNQFRLSLGGSNPIFDFDGDGAVTASDFIEFRLRFGGSI